MAYLGKSPVVGNFQKCDAITVVNGQAGYTLQVGGSNVSPESANHMLVSLNGILQAPTSSFTVSGATLTFVSNLATGDVIDFVMLLGNVLDIGTPSDGTISNAKLGTDVISGETDIGGAIADADLFLLDDGAGGTLRKTAASRIATYIGDNTPSFRAYGTTQAIAADTATVIAYNTESWDTDSDYDNSTYRFTPQVAGKYFVYAIIRVESGSSYNHLELRIRKNAGDKIHGLNSPKYYDSVNVCGLVDMNGSSDYIDFAIYQGSGGSLNTISLQQFNQGGAFKIMA